MSDSTQEEAHTGPIKTPTQLLWAALFSFVVPVFIIIGLVAYVTSESKPAGSPVAERYALGGVTAQELERGVSERLRKVGAVAVRDADRPLKAGEEVFKVQCAACHVTGAAGSPILGDAAAWGPRIKSGLETLINSALKGKGAMGAQSGGDFDDVEIARAVVYLANAGGAKFAEPNRPAGAPSAGGASPQTASAQAASALAAAPTPVAVAAAPATPVAAAPAAQEAAAPVAGGVGEALYKQACLVCHAAGVAGAPKLGDKAAWAPRLSAGVDGLTASVIKGKGAMPPKGGAANATDADIRAAVEFMVNTAK